RRGRSDCIATGGSPVLSTVAGASPAGIRPPSRSTAAPSRASSAADGGKAPVPGRSRSVCWATTAAVSGARRRLERVDVRSRAMPAAPAALAARTAGIAMQGSGAGDAGGGDALDDLALEEHEHHDQRQRGE